ncbi:MAG: lysophospholipid acyltransferase family protein [Bacteroidales bacterium]|nr:lysophospholipid acyltransferase family protein [Bacteroidales bacterium]
MYLCVNESDLIKYKIEFAGFKILYLLIRFNPVWMLRLWARTLGVLMFLSCYRRKVLRKNWKQIVKNEKIKISFLRFSWDYYYRFSLILLESVKGYSMSFEQISHHIIWKGDSKVREVLANGQSAILLLSHFNNWEWLSSFLPSFFQCKVYAVYKPFKNPYFDNFVHHQRESHGMKLYSLKEVKEMIIKALKEPSLMVFLADQRPTRSEFSRAIWVDFFQKKTAFAHGPENIAKKFHLPLFYVRILRKETKYYYEFIELSKSSTIDVTHGLTRTYVRMLEEDISLQPTHYFWSHDRWKFQ